MRRRIVRTNRLVIPNKFASSGTRQTANTYYKGSIDFLNPASAFNGDTDDLESLITGNTLLPSGVTSLKTAEKNKEMLERLQRYNAGIFDQETRDMKALYKLMKTHKTSEMRNKLIKWLANNEDIEEIPVEFEEEVNKYYETAEGRNVKEKVFRARKKKKEEREKKRLEKLKENAPWNRTDPFANIGLYRPEYKKYRNLQEEALALSRGEGEIETLKGLIRPDPSLIPFSGVRPLKKRAPGFIQFADPPSEYLKNHNGFRLDGWAPAPLHTLVRPFKPFILDQEPGDIVEEQKKTLDEWRDEYKEQQKDSRGLLPPKDMVERAFPNTAEPATLPAFKPPNINIIPHPFIAYKKKFALKNGI